MNDTQQAEAAVETAVKTAVTTEVAAVETDAKAEAASELSKLESQAQAVINDAEAGAAKVFESGRTAAMDAAKKVEETLSEAVEAALTIYIVKHTLSTGQTRLLAARRSLDAAKAELATIFRTSNPPMGQPNYTQVGTTLQAVPQGVVSPGVGSYSIETLEVL